MLPERPLGSAVLSQMSIERDSSARRKIRAGDGSGVPSPAPKVHQQLAGTSCDTLRKDVRYG